MLKIKRFKDLKDLFATERPRTVVKIEGNKLKCAWLDSKQAVIKRYEVKFKHPNKLKKFWERYTYNRIINYYAQGRVFWSIQILNIEKN